MLTRTFKQKAQGYGTEPVSITAKINGATVYTGTIPTSADEPPLLPDSNIDLGEVIFSWTREDVLSSQDFTVEITVDNSESSDTFVILTDTIANYVQVYDAQTDKYVSGGPDYFSVYYFQSVTDDQGTYIESDPFENVTIGSDYFPNHPTREYSGQWYWKILPQQTFSAVLKVIAGREPAPA